MSGGVRDLSTVYPFGTVSTSSVVAKVWAESSQDKSDSTAAKFMRKAAAESIWRITVDPIFSVEICERLLLDKECWFRRYVVELLEEIADPAALPALRGRLVDQRREVRSAARKAIERIEDGLEPLLSEGRP